MLLSWSSDEQRVVKAELDKLLMPIIQNLQQQRNHRMLSEPRQSVAEVDASSEDNSSAAKKKKRKAAPLKKNEKPKKKAKNSVTVGAQKEQKLSKRRCRACGQTGHNKSNKNCPEKKK